MEVGVDDGVGESSARDGIAIPPNNIDARSTARFPACADSSSLPSSSDGTRSQSSELARGRGVIGAGFAAGVDVAAGCSAAIRKKGLVESDDVAGGGAGAFSFRKKGFVSVFGTEGELLGSRGGGLETALS